MSDDLISRQAAIDAYLETVSSLCVDEGDGVLTACARDRDILEMLENLPSVQPKTGRWVNTDTTVWDAKDMDGEQELEISIVAAKCSVCERWAEQVNKFPPSPSMTYNFCPYCGAKMRGV